MCNLFKTVAPSAFCQVLSNSVEEEIHFLLDTMLKKVISYGIISASELLVGDEDDNSKELFEMATSKMDIRGEISIQKKKKINPKTRF